MTADEPMRVIWLPPGAIADPANPTAAELAGGYDLSGFLAGDGIDGALGFGGDYRIAHRRAARHITAHQMVTENDLAPRSADDETTFGRLGDHTVRLPLMSPPDLGAGAVQRFIDEHLAQIMTRPAPNITAQPALTLAGIRAAYRTMMDITGAQDTLAGVDATIEGLCACGCGATITDQSPSAWFATADCQSVWHGRGATQPWEVYERDDAAPYPGHIGTARWRPDLTVTDMRPLYPLPPPVAEFVTVASRFDVTTGHDLERDLCVLRLDDGTRYVETPVEMATVERLVAAGDGEPIAKLWRMLDRQLTDGRLADDSAPGGDPAAYELIQYRDHQWVRVRDDPRVHVVPIGGAIWDEVNDFLANTDPRQAPAEVARAVAERFPHQPRPGGPLNHAYLRGGFEINDPSVFRTGWS